jgi:DNA-directed RNA polymerase subunit F
MVSMDRTVKIPAYSGEAKQGTPQDNLTKEQKLALELATKNTQLEEEKSKALEQLKTIEHLRESLAQEQAKSTENARNVVLLQSRVEELQDAIGKISEIVSKSNSI